MSRSIVSLFTGAGGFDLGFEVSGFETKVAVEVDETCCKTLRSNRPSWNVIEAPIESVSSRQIMRTAKLKRRECDLLIGGPPCQPFSKSSYWKTGDSQRLKDPRSNTLKEYIRVLEDLLPKAFVIENVYGLAYEGKDEGLRFLQRAIKRINERHGTKYSFSWDVLNAADYGVPQIRERVFIIGSRDGVEFQFPEPRFARPEVAAGLNLEPYRTTWDAIWNIKQKTFDFTTVGGKFGHLLPSIPHGQNYLYHTERGGGKPIFKWRSRYWSFLLKLAPHQPSWTIQAQPGSAIGPFHWENRRLTVEELCRLQTFPDKYIICGSRSQIQKQLGNAVPSALGELLGREIRKQFFGENVSSKNLKLVPKEAPVAPKLTRVRRDRDIERSK